MEKIKSKKKNMQDATLINNRSSKKKIESLERKIKSQERALKVYKTSVLQLIDLMGDKVLKILSRIESLESRLETQERINDTLGKIASGAESRVSFLEKHIQNLLKEGEQCKGLIRTIKDIWNYVKAIFIRRE